MKSVPVPRRGTGTMTMHRPLPIVLVAAVGIVPLAGRGEQASPPAKIQAILQEHCVKCHGPEKQKSDVRFDTLSADFLRNAAAAETWHDALDAVLIGDMPPDDEPELTTGARAALTDWIRANLKEAAAAMKGQSEGVVMRRLNKTEYRHTMTDLLGVADDYGAKLPPDPLSEEGFRNDGGALGMSALQLEYYLESAREALGKVLVEGERPERIAIAATKSDGLSGFGKGKPGERLGRANYFALRVPEPPRSGVFTIRVKARAELLEGQPLPVLEVSYGNRISGALAFLEEVGSRTVDSAEVQEFVFQGEVGEFPLVAPRDKRPTPTNPKRKDTFLQLVTMRNALAGGKPPKRQKGKKQPEDPNFPKIVIESVEFLGHDHAFWPPEEHRRLLPEAEKKDSPEYVTSVLETFLRRAWRRPASDEELAKYREHHEAMVADGATPVEAWREVFAVALASPNFLFLVEPKGRLDALNDHEIAARLSYFLWSSLPDAELCKLADAGRLRDPAVMTEQVARMLKDERSERFVREFSSQWLDLDGVDRVAVNPEFFPKFDESLKADMIRESQEFFGEIVRSNASVLEVIDADFTMLNNRLARHYGLEGPGSSRFERVSLEGTKRPGGILGHASIHLANSDGGNSHPIKRAVWIRERLLHDPPKPPPPNVPSLDEIDPEFAKLSIVEQMEVHRSDPACNDCHRGIDPWGLALEEYDAIGLWRQEVLRPSGKGKRMEKVPVISTTTLPGGHSVEGVEGLKAYLLERRQEQFTRAFVEKLLTYAIGRSLDLADRPAVDTLTADFAQDGHRIPKLLERIALSEPFLSK